MPLKSVDSLCLCVVHVTGLVKARINQTSFCPMKYDVHPAGILSGFYQETGFYRRTFH